MNGKPWQKTVQIFTKDTTSDSIKECLDNVLLEYPNVMSVDIKWNASNCTLFVRYTEVTESGRY